MSRHTLSFSRRLLFPSRNASKEKVSAVNALSNKARWDVAFNYEIEERDREMFAFKCHQIFLYALTLFPFSETSSASAKICFVQITRKCAMARTSMWRDMKRSGSDKLMFVNSCHNSQLSNHRCIS